MPLHDNRVHDIHTENIRAELEIVTILCELVDRRGHDATGEGSYQTSSMTKYETCDSYPLLNRTSSRLSLLYAGPNLIRLPTDIEVA